MLSNNWVQAIGTVLFGGSLLKWIIPLSLMIFTTITPPDGLNETCILLGGKINRKWFLFNNLIYFVSLILLTLLLFVFKNWIMFIVIVPYIILLYILYWGNFYKRLNAITDNHSFSKYLTILYAIFCLCSKFVYEILSERATLSLAILTIIFWLFVFLLPTRMPKEENDADASSYWLFLVRLFNQCVKSDIFRKKILAEELVKNVNIENLNYQQNLYNRMGTINKEQINCSFLNLLMVIFVSVADQVVTKKECKDLIKSYECVIKVINEKKINIPENDSVVDVYCEMKEIADKYGVPLKNTENNKEKMPAWYKRSLKFLAKLKENYSDSVFDKFIYLKIKRQILIAKNNKNYVDYFKERSVEEWIFSQINNISGDLLESGEYHMHRGALNPLGNKFLYYFRLSLFGLKKYDAKDENGKMIDEEWITKQYKTMLSIIRDLG